MLKAVLAATAIILATPASAQEAGNRLSLVCGGAGMANKHSTTQAYGWNNSGDSADAIITSERSVGFEDQLQLWIEGGAGKARMPRTMLPPIHGGNGGWFDVKDIRVSDTEITGTVAVNALNHPKLVLDRLAGTVSLAGKAGQFNGRCQKFDPATAQRTF